MRYRIKVDGVELTASILGENVRFGNLLGTPIRVEHYQRGFYRWSVFRAGLCPHTNILGRGETCTEALRLSKARLQDGAVLNAADQRASAAAA